MRPLKPFNRKLVIITLVILIIGSACLCNIFSGTPEAPTPLPPVPTSFLSTSPTPLPPQPTKFISASPTQELTSMGPWLLVKTSVGL